MTDELDAPFVVNPDAIASYRESGFLRLKRVLSPEMLGAYGQAITEATLRLNHDHRPLEEHSTYDRAFLQVMNLWRFGRSGAALRVWKAASEHRGGFARRARRAALP